MEGNFQNLKEEQQDNRRWSKVNSTTLSISITDHVHCKNCVGREEKTVLSNENS